MASSYTSLLGLALPVTGELSGSWGDVVNDSITSLLDSAVAGTTTLSTDGNVTLSTTTGASNQARQAILLCSGARTALRTITAPAQSKIYTVINTTTGGFSVKIVGVGPTTGVTIVAGESAVVAWNGTDFIKISNTGGSASFTNVTVSGTTTLSGLTASTALALDASKNVVSVTNTGTGNNVLSASPTLTGTVVGASLQLSSLTATRVPYASTGGLLVDSANMVFNGTRLTVADLADSGLTSGRVVYAGSGGALVDSANLTFDGGMLALSSSGNIARFGDGTNTFDLRFRGANNWAIQYAPSADEWALQRNSVNQYSANGASHIWSFPAGEAMRLTSTGLGIGTSSPTEKLHVAGALRVTGAQTTAGTGVYLDQTSGTGGVSVYGPDNSTQGTFRIYTATANGGTGSTKLTLDSSGNLGLGVTPSAWGSNFKAMQFNGLYGGALSTSAASNTSTNLSHSAYHNGTNWVYGATGFGAARYEIEGPSGGAIHKWFTAPSGTAGNAISFTQAATLTAGGNYLLGTTSDYLASRLLVKTTTTDNSTNALTLQNSAATDLLRVRSDGYTYAGFYAQTTAGVANVSISAGGDLLRSISALKYKQDVRDLESIDISKFRAVRYKSKCNGDDQTLDHFGFIADEVDNAGVKELVIYGKNNEVEGFRYDRMTSVLLKAIQDLKSEFDAYKVAHP